MIIVLELVPIAEEDMLCYIDVFSQTATALHVNKIIE
jgi:hypothetical protein